MCAKSLCFVVVVVGGTRPLSMPLATLTMERSCMGFYFYACVWFCSYSYGALLDGPSGPEASPTSEDSKEPLRPSHLLCGHRIMSLPGDRSSETEYSDTDVQPQDLHRRMRHLNDVMNHFWKRRRKAYLLELRNSRRNATQHSSNRVVFMGDVVNVHDEDQPRGKDWRSCHGI